MATEDAADFEALLATVRRTVGPIPNQDTPGALSTKDVRLVLEMQRKAMTERGEREERRAVRDIEEKQALREHEGRKAVRLAEEERVQRAEQTLRQNQAHLRTAAYRFSALLIVLVVTAFYFADADQRKTIITLTLTTLFGVVTGATGYYFGNKDKEKK